MIGAWSRRRPSRRYRGSGETLKREEFEARKEAAEQARLSKLRNAPKPLCSAGKDLSDFPFLHALAEREEMVPASLFLCTRRPAQCCSCLQVRNGKLTSIIFIRDKNHKGQEVSGYIDYAHRLKVSSYHAP